MRKITSRLIGALISMHLVLAWIAGLNIQPFEFMPEYIWTMIPVIFILCIAFYRLDALFQNYKYHSLGTKFSLIARTPWVWVLIILSTLLVVGIMWYGGQSLKPVEEISRDITFDGDPLIGVLLALAVCSALYVASIIWIYKTLKPIWK